MKVRLVVAAVAAGCIALAGAGVGPSIGLAQGTPTVTTGTASAVTSSSAHVDGTVNPNGTATSYVFQYGTSTSYGEQTSSQSAGSGTSSQSVSTTLNGLPSGKTIHFRLVATYGSTNTVVGEDRTFTTPGPPPSIPAPAATTGSATGVGSHGAELSGTVGSTTNAATYYFEYGTTAYYGVQTSPSSVDASTSAQQVSASLSGLQSGATYHYRLVTRSASGLIATGADQTFTTVAYTQPRPLGLALHAYTTIGHTQIILGAGGQLRLPGGVPWSRGCRGSITVVVSAGIHTVSRRSLGLTRSCRFSERLRLRYGQVYGHHWINVRASFAGNAAVQGTSSRTMQARV
jgi:hypothetical protein